MNRITLLCTIVGLAVSGILISCGSKKSADSGADLTGLWQIYSATRNSRPTGTLKDGYMHFGMDNVLTTNILGEVTRSSYQWNNDKIVSEDPFNYEFEIEQLTSDSLQISGMMRTFHMTFYLNKQLDTLHSSSPVQ